MFETAVQRIHFMPKDTEKLFRKTEVDVQKIKYTTYAWTEKQNRRAMGLWKKSNATRIGFTCQSIPR